MAATWSKFIPKKRGICLEDVAERWAKESFQIFAQDAEEGGTGEKILKGYRLSCAMASVFGYEASEVNIFFSNRSSCSEGINSLSNILTTLCMIST